ncbi:MAG: aminotransferase class I/II-fold pyridoxal phosphate-dependent enzyme [Limnobacter sp.]|nr:aminotransferase class I/II-fold pyridoxal phosphate-dependent enzyme [Limnobacter sp.]
MPKQHIADLALFGGSPLYRPPISTSNLVRPDIEGFLSLLKPALNPAGETRLLHTLEQELAHFHEVPHCVAVCSGFWALVLAIQALALPGKQEVLMPSLTYRRLADVVAWTGLTPRFCEVDPQTLAISAATAKSQITANTALIIGVHPIVNCCDAQGLEALANAHGLPVLFDGVESVYETVQGKRVGGFGAAECFSFHASKLINGFEGGYITTRTAPLAEALRAARLPSSRNGMSASLPAAHAAMALQGLREVATQVAHNRAIYQRYVHTLANSPYFEVLRFSDTEQTSYKNIVVKIKPDWPFSRAHTLALFNAEGILSRVYYAPALHQKPMRYAHISQPLPHTEALAEQFMLMPSGYQVNEQHVEETIGFANWLASHAPDISSRLQEATA